MRALNRRAFLGTAIALGGAEAKNRPHPEPLTYIRQDI